MAQPMNMQELVQWQPMNLVAMKSSANHRTENQSEVYMELARKMVHRIND